MTDQAIDALIEELTQAGRPPLDVDLVERVLAVGPPMVSRLIELALDDELDQADSDSLEVWAPLHAVSLLGDMRAAAAAEPLLTWLDKDDDWACETLPEVYAQIGPPAVAPLRGALLSPRRSARARDLAAECLAAVGEAHDEVRVEVIEALVEALNGTALLDPSDAELAGFIISSLLELDAAESYPAIERAYLDGRVDRTIVGLDDVQSELGRPVTAPPETRGMPAIPLPPLARLPRLAGPPSTSFGAAPVVPPAAMSARPMVAGKKVGRNDPCPCGSGKKYKKCCGR